MCSDIIIARLLGQPSAVPRICGKFQPPAHSPKSRRRSGFLPQTQDSADWEKGVDPRPATHARDFAAAGPTNALGQTFPPPP